MAQQIFTTNDNFTVPEGVTEIVAETWGAGASGGVVQIGTGAQLATGGGGGAYSRATLAVTPFEELSVEVGVGGPPKALGSKDGEDGGDSKVSRGMTVLCLAKGGKKGVWGSGNAPISGLGGAGGLASEGIGDVKFSGGRGGNVDIPTGTNDSSSGGGGAAGDANDGGNGGDISAGGQSSAGGAGGVDGGGAGGSSFDASGNDGSIIGGGGAGAHLGSGSELLSGGGARGEVRINFITPPAVDTLGDSEIPVMRTNPVDEIELYSARGNGEVLNAFSEDITRRGFVLNQVSVGDFGGDFTFFDYKKIFGNITDIGDEDVTKRGFVFGTTSHSNPGPVQPENTDYDDFTQETGTFGVGEFEYLLEGLSGDTQYFYRAFAENGGGVVYGDEISFNVAPLGEIKDENGVFAEGLYSLDLEDLNHSTQYFIRAFGENINGAGFGQERVFSTPLLQLAEIITKETDEIQRVSAQANGRVNYTASTITRRGFVYDIESRANPGNVDPVKGRGVSFYNSDNSQLFISDSNIWYGQTFTVGGENVEVNKVAFMLRREAGGSPGNVTISIRETSGGLPTGSDIVSATFDGAELPENFDDNGGYEVDITPITLTAGIKYAVIVRASAPGSEPNRLILRQRFSESEDYVGGERLNSSDTGENWTTTTDRDFPFEIFDANTYSFIKDESGSFGIGDFRLLVESLIPGTDYFIRAFSQNAHGFSYGNEVEFTALLTPPEMFTLKPQGFTKETISAKGNIVSTFENATKRGFVFGEETKEDPGNVAPGSSGYDDFVEEEGDFDTGVFELDIENLDNTKDYFIRAFAENTDGFGYGNEIKFKIGDWIPIAKGEAVWTPISK